MVQMNTQNMHGTEAHEEYRDMYDTEAHADYRGTRRTPERTGDKNALLIELESQLSVVVLGGVHQNRFPHARRT